MNRTCALARQFVLVLIKVCMCAQSLSHVGFCDPVDCSPPGSSVHGILQARVLEWVAFPFSRGLPNPGIEPGSPALAGRFFTTNPPGKP